MSTSHSLTVFFSLLPLLLSSLSQSFSRATSPCASYLAFVCAWLFLSLSLFHWCSHPHSLIAFCYFSSSLASFYPSILPSFLPSIILLSRGSLLFALNPILTFSLLLSLSLSYTLTLCPSSPCPPTSLLPRGICATLPDLYIPLPSIIASLRQQRSPIRLPDI